MQPSSLIFLLVIAIWAVYLLQHWLRRREHLSTATTLDRFSESMRVLDRTKLGRASASESTGSIPLHRKPAGGATMDVPVPAPHEATARSAARRVPATRPSVRMPLRPVLGVLLLVGVLTASLGSGLALAGVVAWLVPALGTLLAMGSLLALRQLAAARTRATRRVPAMSSSVASRAAWPKAADLAHSAAGSSPRSTRPSTSPVAASASGSPVQRGESTASALLGEEPAREDVFDIVALDAPQRPVPAVGEEEWSPVPVPIPTYMLKARVADIVADDDEDDVASPYATVSDLSERRRAVGG